MRGKGEMISTKDWIRHVDSEVIHIQPYYEEAVNV